VVAEGRVLQAQRLYEAGLNDHEISAEMKVPVPTVQNYLSRAGVKRTNPLKKWTPELIIDTAQRWVEKYGSLSATDWTPSMLRKLGHADLVRDYYDFGAPAVSTVQKYFGSWSEMMRQAGIPTVSNGARFK
jgi:hypothetical protein